MVTGHVQKRGKRGWNSLVIDYGYDAAGIRRRKRRTIKRRDGRPVTKAQAEAELRRVLAEIDAGTYVEPSELTVAAYLRRWFETVKPRLARKSIKAYTTAIETHIIPNLGSVPLAGLRPLQIQELYARLLESGHARREGGLSPKTLQLVHIVLHSALRQAVKWQLLVRNPADAVDAPRPRKKEVTVLDDRAAAELLDAARAYAAYPVHPVVALGLWTGLRRGEVFALRWSDIDLEGRTLRVNRSLLKEGRAHSFHEPKTQAGRREVPLPDSAVALLKALRRRQAELRLQRGPAFSDEGLVFTKADGTVADPAVFNTHFRRVARLAGIPTARFHDLRHTYATKLLAQGVHPKVVQELLGHAQVTITLGLYGHVLPGLKEAATAKIEEAFGHQSGTNPTTLRS